MIAHTPGERFNPLFIYGGAVWARPICSARFANRLGEHGYRVLYCSAERFTNDLVRHPRSIDGRFRAKVSAIDVLLIDDVQFIVGKGKHAGSFFHTFNDLHAAR